MMCLLFAALAFSNPPDANRPETWYHLLDGNVSREGIVADLDAAKSAGLGGIQLFHGVSGAKDPWPGVTNEIPCLSKNWDSVIAFAADECHRRGLTFKMQNCPGWSMAGGPWIGLDNCQRQLCWSRTEICGGAPVSVDLPKPREIHEGSWMAPNPESWRDYRDIRVVAFPTPEGDSDGPFAPVAVRGSDEPSGTNWTNVCSENSDWNRPVKAERHPENTWCETDFGRRVTIRTVCVDSPAQLRGGSCYDPNIRLSFQVPDGAGGWRTVRAWPDLPASNWQDDAPLTLAVPPTETDRARFTWSCARPLTLRKLHYSSRASLTSWESLASRTLRQIMRSGEPAFSSAVCVDPERIVDLTARLAGDRLTWTPPKGRWTVLRFGHVNSGLRNGPAPAGATGWECDKLDRRGIEANFAGYIGRLIDGPLKGKLDGFLLDSWECRSPMWTAKMTVDAKDVPRLCGYIVGTARETRAFYRAWRRQVGERIEREFYGRMGELAREHGLSVAFETAAGDVYAGDILAYWKHADVPMCEFWNPRSDEFVGYLEFKPIKPCASAAHLYGKRRVDAEAFTGFLSWKECPRYLKDIANFHFAEGVTHLVFHTTVHNPTPGALPPGSALCGCFGTPFLQTQTWWPWMREFTDYLSRCSYMLERGKPVADLLVYLGDETDHKPIQRKLRVSSGLKYDYLNFDALKNRLTVKDGKWVTPDGTSYEAIWVRLAEEIGDLDKETAKLLRDGRRQGAKVVRSPNELDVRDDVEIPAAAPIVWCHRRDGATDIYFVANDSPTNAWTGALGFRGHGKMDFDLAPAEALFVVFENGRTTVLDPVTGRERQAAPAFRPLEANGWTLAFPSGRGWADEPLKLSALGDWRDLAPNEEAKHFSGRATYRTTFAGSGREAWLDLGTVEVAAAVKVNGVDCGRRWSYPYRFDISRAVKAGENVLEVEIANVWAARIAYDGTQPEEKRRTWTLRRELSAGLQPSGLLGPVTVADVRR